VTCATGVPTRMRERNVGAAQIITFRIGINVGDIIVYGDDIFGDGVACEIKAGDVVVIPAGTGHWFTRIDDHIDYIMVRIDPDKVTPLKGEAQSRDYLSKPAKKGE
jgi:hypothetical protein